ncbi:alpha/beta fold hydrolase [Actinoplanes teichomyceticus]|uniref:Pimeloyl-ACP methyl ester carboxylesterase n=1 Tax=Actinoplanes teichomyceticus TaxID=1867 RepID=A0A561WM26_ACTTI|nr:alpha/beta hydrolase [Actinoplanes teichomyceticus]TWG24924.1 pimeloyl-ACP methyl ester carboxylesterase [Actinoplanes teichomyceticus]GIF15539.1 hydrolase [Actinoplanes teichomyceticus]
MPIYTGFDGTPLHYDDTAPGDHPPVIVLAGGAARHPDYLGDLAGLPDRHRLLVPHLRGVGRSPAAPLAPQTGPDAEPAAPQTPQIAPDPEPVDAASRPDEAGAEAAVPDPGQAGAYWRQAADLERLRVHLGQERIVLVGHSAGTRLALAYAAQYPDRVAGLALVTPPATYLVDTPPDAEDLIARRRGEPAFDAAEAASKAGPDLGDDAAFNAWHRACAPLGYAAWGPAEQTHALVGEWALPAVKAYFSVDPPADFATRLARVTAPVLVIAGAEDCLTGLAPVVALATLFPSGRAEVLARCGHYPWVEQPAAFRRVLDEYLSLCGDTAAVETAPSRREPHHRC